MADRTALAESSQALFCAIADYIGATKTNKIFDTKKYKDYTTFRSVVGAKTLKESFKRIETPGVSSSDIENFLNSDIPWYTSSILIAKKLVNDINKIDPDLSIAAKDLLINF